MHPARRQVHGLYWNDVPRPREGSNSLVIPFPGKMGPMVIDKNQPIESIGSRLGDHTVSAHGPTKRRHRINC